MVTTMVPVQVWAQQAAGEFITYLKPNSPHCGPKVSIFPVRATFQYQVEIIYRMNALDPNGFLLDNTWFVRYFGSLRDAQISISCEMLAQLVATDCCRALGDRCESVTVMIWGIPGVHVKCTVRNE